MSIASASAAFEETIRIILSAREYAIRQASGAWLTLANAGTAEGTATYSDQTVAVRATGKRNPASRAMLLASMSTPSAMAWRRL